MEYTLFKKSDNQTGPVTHRTSCLVKSLSQIYHNDTIDCDDHALQNEYTVFNLITSPALIPPPPPTFYFIFTY